VALFHKDPFKHGVRTTATIERVVVTDYSHDHSGGRQDPEVYLTFRFTDEQGAAVMHEHRLAVEHVPAPGSIVDIAYVPGELDTIDYDRETIRPPDPGVPRGWSAGIFAVEDLGTHRSGSPDERLGIDKQRELFRTGRRARAEVVSMREGHWQVGRRNEGEMIFDLRIDGTIVEAAACVSYYPQIGDTIEVAISDDGTGLAFDTDERYSGGPGQGLVFTTPSADP
jgi:hypothetical protein